MEKITTYNYEAFYLDYLEGNLDENGQVMLFKFLDANPMLKSELELDGDILDFTLNTESESLTKFEKEDLKHFECKEGEICLQNVNDFMVAEVENEISTDKKVLLDEFIIEHDLQASRDYFHATKLKADLSEIYPNKSELKKKGTIIPLFVKMASVAAVGLLVFNLVSGGANPSETYSPRNGEFALGLDSSNHSFEIKTNNADIDQNNYATVSSMANGTNKVKETIQPKDTIVTPSFNFNPNNDFVENKVIEEDKNNDNPIIPLQEKDNDDLAVVNNSENTTDQIKLVDMYKPVTNLTNSYTNLDVSYQKSAPESDYQVTALSVGKFSFERKKRK
jgi:hypothetical protein